MSVEVSKYFSKKQIKEDNDLSGYGKRTNCYDIKDFLSIYMDYNLEILFNKVSYNEVWLIFASSNKKGIRQVIMQIPCNQVKYTFTK